MAMAASTYGAAVAGTTTTAAETMATGTGIGKAATAVDMVVAMAVTGIN
jgi:hypothetical protein